MNEQRNVSDKAPHEFPASTEPNVDWPGRLKAETITVGGLPIVRFTRKEMCALMLADVAAARTGHRAEPRVITSANGSVVAAYHANPRFRAIIDSMDLIDADGMPLVQASRLLCQRPLPERIATTDFLLDASAQAAHSGIRFYFIGARNGVAARAAEHLRYRYPGLQIVGTRHGYFDRSDLPRLCEKVRAAGADVLWLGLGAGRQEEIALECRDRLSGLGWVRTCGGLFDHYGGGVSRAPDWMQKLGLEWAYRGAREPLRLGSRYLVTNPQAAWHLATKTHD